MENPDDSFKNPDQPKRNIVAISLFLMSLIIHSQLLYGFSINEIIVKDTLTVITYNIHHGRGVDGEVDINRIADVLIESNADIIALQEVDINTERSGKIDILEVLSEKTGLEYTAFGKNIDFEGGEYGNAILSRYPIENEQNIHFKNISGEQRGVLATIIKVNQTPVLFLNTHLDHTGSDNSERVLYADKISNEILPFYEDHITILGGDLNDGPESETYQIINKRLWDAWNESGTGDGFTIPVLNPNRRIDYIFYSGSIKPEHAEVIQTEASDHLPLVVTFMFTND